MRFPALAFFIALPVTLSACATTQPQVPTDPAPASAACNADAAASFIGKTASSETGALLLKMTGAKTLRWAGPGMALTMDYRADRLTVAYDNAMAIERISCG